MKLLITRRSQVQILSPLPRSWKTKKYIQKPPEKSGGFFSMIFYHCELTLRHSERSEESPKFDFIKEVEVKFLKVAFCILFGMFSSHGVMASSKERVKTPSAILMCETSSGVDTQPEIIMLSRKYPMEKFDYCAQFMLFKIVVGLHSVSTDDDISELTCRAFALGQATKIKWIAVPKVESTQTECKLRTPKPPKGIRSAQKTRGKNLARTLRRFGRQCC